jgi:2-polyprenyl-6-methoxyphenol hydroxylase-like FAD-dependent oxidoreductase
MREVIETQMTQSEKHFDVVIIGAGLAGLSLARQLLLNSDKKILLVDKRAQVPPAMQKVGEATVQMSAYYFSKVLDLEEHLLREHFMKYNLRFYWKTAGRENSRYEDYGQAYIRQLSNIASYQLDRNKIEGEMLRLNLEHPNFEFCAPVFDLAVSLSETGLHSLSFRTNDAERTASATWVVDTSGRGKFLARRMELLKANPIRHGAHFFWVEGLVNIEKLTDSTPQEIRLNKARASLGHLPVWLATNHFCGEGFWFWTIPLQGKTSLGLVYDNTIFPRERVASLEKLIEWVCEEFPLFARDLPRRKVLCHSALKDFSYDCQQTISASRWALAGEAGRFTDPLYSPGGDLISLYNTLITDAILTDDREELTRKVRLYEQMMKALYEAYVPSYAVSYDALGDQEAMTLKYVWELSVYFAFYVFPFINDLFTNSRFLPSFLKVFSRLGAINKNLQLFVSNFYHWKKLACQQASEPVFNDFTEIAPLRTAESAFYRVGVSVEEARGVLDEQLDNLRELARFIVAHVYGVVLADERVLTNRAFIEGINLEDFHFDPEEMRAAYERYAEAAATYEWSFDPFVLRRFRTERLATEACEELMEGASVVAGQGGVEWTTMRL